MPPSTISQPDALRLNVPAPHPEHIAQYRTLYHRHYGELLDEQTAATQLYDLLILVRWRHVTQLPVSRPPRGAKH